jgi:hypothetical protein
MPIQVRKLFRDTRVGKFCEGHINLVNWDAIDNEFAIRVKAKYDANEFLSDTDSYVYEEESVMFILERVFSAHLAAAVVPKPVPVVYIGDDVFEDRTFLYTETRYWQARHEYGIVLDCRTSLPARTAAKYLANLFSCMRIQGVAYPYGKNVYLLTSTKDAFLSVHGKIDEMGLEHIRRVASACRVQMFDREAVSKAYTIRMPEDDGKELVSCVPDTFTVETDDDSKVHVIKLDQVTVKENLGTYIVAQGFAEANSLLASLRVCVDDLDVSFSRVQRNVKIFAKLREKGFSVRASWSNGVT